MRDIKSGLGEMAHYYLVSNIKDWKFYKKNLGSVLNKNFNKKKMKSLILRLIQKESITLLILVPQALRFYTQPIEKVSLQL